MSSTIRKVKKARKTSTSEILRRLIVDAFGGITVSKAKWEPALGNVPSAATSFPRRGYFQERLANNPDAPINARCASYVLELYRLALNHDTHFDKLSVSLALLATLNDVADAELQRRITFNSRSYAKQVDDTEALIGLLAALLNKAVGQKAVAASALQSTAAKYLTGAAELATSATRKQYAITGARVYQTVKDVDYDSRIMNASHIDLVHVHGLLWVKSFKKALMRRVAIGNVNIRVALSDLNPTFVEYYSEARGIGKESLKEKHRQAMAHWREIAANASSTSKVAIITTASFPAKSLYKFDSAIFVTPATNPASKSQFLSFEFDEGGSTRTAYRMYEREIESVLSNPCDSIYSAPALEAAPGTASLPAPTTAAPAHAFLRNMLKSCFGTLYIDFSAWQAVGDEKLPPNDYFQSRLRKSVAHPVNTLAAQRIANVMEIALDGRSPFDADLISGGLASYLAAMTERQDLRDLAYGPWDEVIARERKHQLLMHALRCVLVAVKDSSYFDQRVARMMLHDVSVPDSVSANREP